MQIGSVRLVCYRLRNNIISLCMCVCASACVYVLVSVVLCGYNYNSGYCVQSVFLFSLSLSGLPLSIVRVTICALFLSLCSVMTVNTPSLCFFCFVFCYLLVLFFLHTSEQNISNQHNKRHSLTIR